MTLVDVGGLYRIGYRRPSSSSQPMCGGACPPLGKEFPMKFGVDQTPWAGYRSSGRLSVVLTVNQLYQLQQESTYPD